MEGQTNATYQEIMTQPEAWAQAVEAIHARANAIKAIWDDRNFSRVIFTGCGSTYYLSLAAATLFQTLTGILCQAVPGGELWLNPGAAYQPGETALLVAISRSGTTTETVKAVQRFQSTASGSTIVISNDGDSELALLGDITIAIPNGQEKSVAQTRSFASMYVAAVAFAALFARDEGLLVQMNGLPDAGEKLLVNARDTVRAFGEDLSLDRFYFLGSGLRYGLACEANLKMKEMTLTHSEPFHFMEFRHGPMSMVTDSTAVIGMLSDANRSSEQQVLKEMGALGGKILSIGSSGADIVFGAQLPEAVRNVLYLPPLQLMAFYRAIAKGLNPDQPTNLTAVIKLDVG